MTAFRCRREQIRLKSGKLKAAREALGRFGYWWSARGARLFVVGYRLFGSAGAVRSGASVSVIRPRVGHVRRPQAEPPITNN